MFNFTPTAPETLTHDIQVPFIEDARADFAPYYTALRSNQRPETKIRQCQEDIEGQMLLLGGVVERFIEGQFAVAGRQRYGYAIEFHRSGTPGVIHVAGLPIRSFTSKKKAQVLVQALLIVRDWLKSGVTAKVFNPGSDPLLPYLLVDGQRTLVQFIHETRRLPPPQSPAGAIVISKEE